MSDDQDGSVQRPAVGRFLRRLLWRGEAGPLSAEAEMTVRELVQEVEPIGTQGMAVAAAGREHVYPVRVRWTGNTGEGTQNYRAYFRSHEIVVPGKPTIEGSADPAFRGDPARYNPEELLVASVSACHMLWYLHLCADAGVVVTAYADDATGTLLELRDGSGRFSEIVLRPRVTVAAGADEGLASALHARAHELCFVAASLAVPVTFEPVVEAEGDEHGEGP